MDTPPILLSAHCVSAFASAACVALHRAMPAACALGLVAAADVVLALDMSSWQLENILAFLGPSAVLVAVALTVGASVSSVVLLATPLLFIAASSVSRGVELGISGLSWWLVVANLYAAATSTVLLRIGARKIERFVAAVTGIVIATCAPAVVGWTYRALGDSVRAATVVDCLFLGAIVVASLLEWIRRSSKPSSPSAPAQSSTP